MSRVYLCWSCLRCGAENRASLDPWDEEPEINWAKDAALSERCDACGAKHRLQFNVVVEAVKDAPPDDSE